MEITVKHVSEDELNNRIRQMDRALKELDMWEARWESRAHLVAELETARWLLDQPKE